MEFGFGIPIVSGIPVSLSLNSKAQDSTSKTYTGIRNPDFLAWGVEIIIMILLGITICELME